MITKTRVSTNLGPAVGLQLKHYLKHGLPNQAMGKFLPYWEIIYFPKDLELVAISETSNPISTVRKERFHNPPGITYDLRLKRQPVWTNPKINKRHQTIISSLNRVVAEMKEGVENLKVEIIKRTR